MLGVPLGTMIGQASGWRTTFLVVAAIGLVALAAVARFVPAQDAASRDVRAEARAVLLPAVLLTLAISVAASTGMFALFTYVTPILTDVAGVASRQVSWVLLACGVGLTIGNVIGARAADWRGLPSLAAMLCATVLIQTAMRWTLTTPWSATVSVIVWGMVAFATCAILQAEIVTRAAAAPNLASTLNIGAFNLGNAIGAAVGAAGLAHGLGLRQLPLLAATFSLGALALAAVAMLNRNVGSTRNGEMLA